MTEYGEFEREILIGRAKVSGSNVVICTRPGFEPQVVVGNERVICQSMSQAFGAAMNWVEGRVQNLCPRPA